MSEKLNLRKFEDSIRPTIKPLTSELIERLKQEITDAIAPLGIPDDAYFFDVGFDETNEPRHRLLLQENGFGFGILNQDTLGSTGIYVSFSPASVQFQLHSWDDVLDQDEASDEEPVSFSDVDLFINSLTRSNFIARESSRQLGIDFKIESGDGVHYYSPEYEYNQDDPAGTVQEIMKAVNFLVKANMAKVK
jgi:hypothetical protein